MKTSSNFSCHLACLVFATLTASASATINLYLSANDVQSAETSGFVSGTTFTTENFSSATVGAFSSYVGTVGTYTTASGAVIKDNNIYGGNGSGKYLGISSGTTTTLTLTAPAQYFGIYFTAGDAYNSFQIKREGVTLLSFNTAELIKLLPNTSAGRITAIDGLVYNTQDYYGQPGLPPETWNNNTEPYGYIHIIATGGTTFDQVLLSQADNGITAVFENDNHSIRATAPTIPGVLVNVTGAIPEPSTLWFSLSCLSLMVLRRRRA